MRKLLVLILSCGLVGCVHGRSSGVDTVLQKLPGAEMGVVVFTKNTQQMLEFLASEVTAVEQLVGGKVQAEIEEDLGFNPITVGGMVTAGLDPTRPLALWIGGSSPEKALFQGVLPIGERSAFLATLDKILAKGSLSRGSPIATARGDWIGFSRTNGQKKEPAGGLLLQGKYAVFTNGEREQLQVFSTGPSVAQHPHLKRLQAASQGKGQVGFFASPKWLEKFNAESLSAMPVAAAAYGEVRMTPNKEVFMESLSFSLPETLVEARRFSPEPVGRVPGPKGALIAGTASYDLNALFAWMKRDEQMAKVLLEQEQRVRLIEPMLAHLGADLTFTIGVDGEPSNPMILLGSLFARLDLAGGDPKAALAAGIQAAKGMDLPLDKLKAVDGGYDLFIPPIVLIRFRTDDNALSIAYGREAVPDPESRLAKLAKGQAQAGFFDAAKVGRMVSKMLVKVPIAAKVGLVLQRYGAWETWSGPPDTITAGYGRLRISP